VLLSWLTDKRRPDALVNFY